MGCDIVATANHRLDTTSIERLAAHVSARLQAVVKYGYDDADFNFVEIGTTGSGQRVLRLSSLIEESDTPATIVYQLYDSNNYELYNTWIYRDCFRVFAHYSSGRYGIFCGSFTGKYNYWDTELQYRRDVYAQVLLMGGDTAIYHGDQCGSSFVSDDAETQPFAAILHKVTAQDNVIDICAWLRSFSGNYLQDDPEAFIDDFSYWPSVAQITERARKPEAL